MKSKNIEKERALNIIWNASGDYSFKPDIMAFDENRNADIYLNYIIGALHKYYKFNLFKNFLNGLKDDKYYDILVNLLWIGLEKSTYEKSIEERPVIKDLRRIYAQKFLNNCNGASSNYLVDEIKIANFRRAIGENPKMTHLAFNILNDLEFDKCMDTEQIILKMKHIMKKYFDAKLIPAHRSEKGKLNRYGIHFPKLFNIITEDNNYTELDFKKRKLVFSKPSSIWINFTDLKNERNRKFIEKNYGTSIISEVESKAIENTLCIGNHKNCHIHFTRGENKSDSSIKKKALKQREENLKYYNNNISNINNNILKLTNKIKNAISNYSESYMYRSESGRLASKIVWRNIYLNDKKIFTKIRDNEIENLSVDIMLDASSSQLNRHKIIASMGYIIAESLTRCQIPVKVYSFCSENGYTIINLFRDYNEPKNNKKILNYFSSGCNRDGLAIRTAFHMIKNSSYEHKILIILSDGLPNDTQGITGGKFSRVIKDYTGETSINDTAFEIRKGLRSGVSTFCVFTGVEDDIPKAKKIYGHDLAYIKSEERFADIVGIMIQNEIENI